MKTKTSVNIVIYIESHGWRRPDDLAKHFGLSTQAIHRHLRALVESGVIVKKGSAPHTIYELSPQRIQPSQSLSKELQDIIEQNFSYLSPRGSLLFGEEAFQDWLASKKLVKDYIPLAKAYSDLNENIYGPILSRPFATTDRLRQILPDLSIQSAWVSDFYALPQFGKTKLGNLVHVCKTSPAPKFMNLICSLIGPDIKTLLHQLKIDTICWVPHSIKRPSPFLPTVRKHLALDLPEIQVRKIFAGSIPVPQKSIARLEDRIENARSTLYVDPLNLKIKRVLVIDDAIGSGATINELSKILTRTFHPQEIHAYAIVGSYKGFEVISQV